MTASTSVPAPYNNLVLGNFIGTDSNSDTGLGNGSGVDIFGGSTGNTIGAGNVISGNSASTGLVIAQTGTTGNLVIGCYIGTNASGTAPLPNGTGVDIYGGATNNTIGGLTATPGTGAGNLISGNTYDGIKISGSGTSGNVVAGNLIGTDITGTIAIANYAGVEIDTGASGNLIGTNGDGVNDAPSATSSAATWLPAFS